MRVLASSGLPVGEDLKRLRRMYESKRLEQTKRFKEALQKIVKEERETWFPKKKKSENDPLEVEVVDD